MLLAGLRDMASCALLEKGKVLVTESGPAAAQQYAGPVWTDGLSAFWNLGLGDEENADFVYLGFTWEGVSTWKPHFPFILYPTEHF